jgi:hypothetical protein
MGDKAKSPSKSPSPPAADSSAEPVADPLQLQAAEADPEGSSDLDSIFDGYSRRPLILPMTVC